jgi:hypothetical protein
MRPPLKGTAKDITLQHVFSPPGITAPPSNLKGTGVSLKGRGFSLKGTGFSPYINPAQLMGASAPEGMPPSIRPAATH